MPWDASSFSSRHNKKLKGPRAAKAASIANAILAKTGNEASAIRIANAQVGGTIKHRSFGLDSVKG